MTNRYQATPDFKANSGKGRLWRHKEYNSLYLLAQVSRRPDWDGKSPTDSTLWAFIALGGNRFREPVPFDELPFDLFTRITEPTEVLFS